ncbi:MAG: hypothetical protein WD231_00090 [Candidatus Woykebacteria bacterium]
MESIDRNNHNVDREGDFYKGLFFGLLLGVGLVWFLGTKEGEKIKKQLADKGEEFVDRARESIDKALSEGFIEDESLQSERSHTPDQPPPPFFEGEHP